MSSSSRARASARWALLLLVGGAIGFSLSYFGHAAVDDDTPPTPILVTTTIIRPAGEPAVPEAVEATRRALLAAAQSGDYESLLPYVSERLTYTFGGPVEGGPIAYWQELERTTDELPLETLAAVLRMPCTLANGIYVWPFAYSVARAGELTAHEREVLAPLGSPVELFAPGTGYLGWRAGIEPDGTWVFFVAGD